MPVEAAIYLKRYDFKRSVKQVLWRPMTLLVTLRCLPVTYDRAGFTYKSLRNHVQKYYVFQGGGVAYAPYAPCMSRPLIAGVFSNIVCCSWIYDTLP